MCKLALAAVLSVAVLAGVAPAYALPEDPFDVQVRHDLAFVRVQLGRSVTGLPVTSYPMLTDAAGAWRTTGRAAWTAGFFPGSLWHAYQATNATVWESRARAWTAGLEADKYLTSTHDLGFMVFDSFGNGYRLTGARAYRDIVLVAAHSLATRYNPVVGAFKSWDGGPTDHITIIDNMMNLELPFWAARNGGDPRWRAMAVTHALTTRRWFVRPDGGTISTINFDPTTGLPKTQPSLSGPVWSRGQAWGLHGFSMAWRETRDQRFLDTARLLARYFVDHLPADSVPFWHLDERAGPRDTSAAAIAAAGLMELARIDPDPSQRQGHLAAAKRILSALSSRPWLAEDTTARSVLLHGTYNLAPGNADVGTVWGDYYFAQALLRYPLVPPSLPRLRIVRVAASSHDGNVPANVVDGNPATRWSALGAGQWIRLDLGAPRLVRKVGVAWYRGEVRTSGFRIETSLDGARWTAGTAARSSGQTAGQETYDIGDRTARYVRLVGYGNTWNAFTSITELTVY
jgi:unsaturated chondroitin disaccharide hydrolase